jgi:hypothetical protein
MKRSFLVALLCLLAVPSFADIKSITPARGTLTGGDTVTIVVDQPLYSCPVCSPPVYEAEVTFVGVPARSVTAYNDTIRAVTPSAHFGGTVTVAVSSHGTPYGTTTFTYYGWDSELTDRSNYEKVLIPLALPQDHAVPGAFGTLWSSDFWFSNPTPWPVELFNDVTCTYFCPPPPPGSGYPQFGAGTLGRITPVPAAGTYGLLYYVQKTYANDVSFSLHVRDLSHDTANAGTEIGVVRERDFRGTSFDILNVPIDAVSRAALRVYDVNGFNNISADVTFYSMDSNQLVASTTIPLSVAVKVNAGSPLAAAFPPLAGVGQIGDIRNTFAFIQAGFPSHVRVHVELTNGANQSWGFVAVTNNATQLITTYRPE